MGDPFEFRLTSECARRAFNIEIMPFIQDLSIFTAKDLDMVYGHLKETVLPRSRNQTDHSTYSRLIRYKSIDSSDTQFFDDLDDVLTSWYERAKARMERSNEQAAGLKSAEAI